MMSINEMQSAICEKLTELVELHQYMPHSARGPLATYWIWKDSKCQVNWAKEGFRICHEAEKLLRNNQFHYAQYDKELWNVLFPAVPYTGNLGYLGFQLINATYEHKLESLCRIWFPERFK